MFGRVDQDVDERRVLRGERRGEDDMDARAVGRDEHNSAVDAKDDSTRRVQVAIRGEEQTAGENGGRNVRRLGARPEIDQSGNDAVEMEVHPQTDKITSDLVFDGVYCRRTSLR